MPVSRQGITLISNALRVIGFTLIGFCRYFEGVHGEKGKEGELFGIKNIFRLHEDTLATKMAVSY